MASKKPKPTFTALSCSECNEPMQVMLGFQPGGLIRLAARCMGCEEPEVLEFHDTLLWRHTITLEEGQWVAITNKEGERVYIQSNDGELKLVNDHWQDEI